MLHSVFARLDCWLRNKPYPGPAFYECDDVFESLFEDNDPWQTCVYWYVRTHIKWIWDFPGDTYRKTKWFIQRGKRGWADCDTWSLDSYLDRWLPAALKHLKEHKHGTPMAVFPTHPIYQDKDGNPTEAATKIAVKRWNRILDQIIAGFEASIRATEGLYEKELGEYPIRRPKDVSREVWKKLQHERFLKSQKLTKRDEKIFQNGMKLFAKHYWSLWD